MPLVSNETGYHTCDGTWQLIASTGSVWITTSNKDVKITSTASATPPLEVFIGHPILNVEFGHFSHSTVLENGRHLWIKADNGIIATITATDVS